MLTIVGVGSGDPELITLKALKAIYEADDIALADSGAESAVEKIASAYWRGKSVLRLSMPMRGNAENWRAAHEAAARALLERLDAGRNVAYPVLGDPSLYATSAYLLPLIAPRHPCRVIPGVPAMCAAAARTGIPLAKGRERLVILSGLEENAVLPESNTVIMKAGKDIEAIREKLGTRRAYLAENIGMEDERVLPLDNADYSARSYFTTILIPEE